MHPLNEMKNKPDLCIHRRIGLAYGRQRTLMLLVALFTLLIIVESQAAGMREVWVTIREDEKVGTGTVCDPFDGGTSEKLNGLFEKFKNEYGDNLTIHFGPGVYEGDKPWRISNNWKIRGAGMDVTIFRTKANPEAITTVGFSEGDYTKGPFGFEISDLTFDFNILNLRRPNRAFIHSFGNTYTVSYVYVKGLPEWSSIIDYNLGQKIRYRDMEFIATKTNRNKSPLQGNFWSVLRPNQPWQLPIWEHGKIYDVGEAVTKGASAYVCIAMAKNADPTSDTTHWKIMNPDAVDPDIYTTAVFVHSRPPEGSNRVSRIKVINGNGSAFYGREAFLIGLGGNDCVIEDCVIDQFRGDYGSLIVISSGQHSAIRRCTVRGNDGLLTMAYGGWACWDAVFEDNFCSNVHAATNIDSLRCRNVIFRNNIFMNCQKVGILVNVSGSFIDNHRRYSLIIDGKVVDDFSRSSMDGLFIYNNLVQMLDEAPYGAIQVQTEGLRNVAIWGNTMRTTSGAGRARAIGVLKATNAVVHDNLCETNMYSEIIATPTVWYGNLDLTGYPMKDSTGKPIVARIPDNTASWH